MALRRRFNYLGIAALVIVVLGILAAGTFSFKVGASPNGSTNVGGLISTNTTWTAANSPLHRHLQHPGTTRSDFDHRARRRGEV